MRESIKEFNYRIISEDFMENRYSIVKYFNFINNKDLDGKLIRNSKLDRNREPWRVWVEDTVVGFRHNLNFDSKFEMLNFLIMLTNNDTLKILGYSTIKEKNCDTYTLID